MGDVVIERTAGGLEIRGPSGGAALALPAGAEAVVLHEAGLYVAVVGAEAGWLQGLPEGQAREYGLALMETVREVLAEGGVEAARAAGLLYVSAAWAGDGPGED